MATRARKSPKVARGEAARAALDSGERPLTAREVAGLCGVELKTVHNWVMQGWLGHFRTPGRHLRFHAAEVRRFLSLCGMTSVAVRAFIRVLVIAAPSSRTALSRALRGRHLQWVRDPLAGLVHAGRIAPDAVVVDSMIVRGIDSSRYLQVLTRELQRAKIIWLGARSPEKAAGVVTVARRDTRSLRRELEPLSP